MNTVKLTSVCNITTGKLDANAAVEGGKYPYFTCAPEPLRINTYDFDDNVILVAGNNASGDFHCRRYNGKFNAYQRTYVITAKSGYDIDYIFYNFLINLRLLKKVAQGSQTKFLTMGILDNFEIADVELTEQRRTVALLKCIDEKIIINTSICSDLESMAKLLYDYWFVQFDFPDENGRPYKSSGGKMVWNEELKREIPEGWSVDALKNLISYNRGVSYTGNDLVSDGTPIISLASIDREGRYIPDGIKYYGKDYPKAKVLKPYDLVMANTDMTQERAVMGKIIFVPDIFESDVLSTHHITTVQTKDELKSYLMMTTQTEWFHNYIKGFSSGTNVLGMDMIGFEDYLLVYPDKKLLYKFDVMIRNLYAKVFSIYKENEQLASLRDFLLPMMMNGQVKVGKEGA